MSDMGVPRITLVWLYLCSAGALAVESPDFEKQVQPVLAAKCLKCHGGDTPKGNLDLRSKAGMLGGGRFRAGHGAEGCCQELTHSAYACGGGSLEGNPTTDCGRVR